MEDLGFVPEQPPALDAKPTTPPPDDGLGFTVDSSPSDDGLGFTPEDPSIAQHDKYGTTGQQLLTGVEGAAKGIAGPLATGAELGLSKLGVPGISAEDQAGRAAENPLISHGSETAAMTSSLLTGVGEAGLIAKSAAKLAPEAVMVLGKLGSAALQGAITSGALQAGDEVSKAMLGTGGDAKAITAGILASSTLGAVTGGLFSGASSGLKKIADDKIGSKAQELLAGFGAPKGLYDSVPTSSWFKLGAKIQAGTAAEKLAEHSPELGAISGVPGGYYIGRAFQSSVAKLLGTPIDKLKNYAFTKALSEGWVQDAAQAIDMGNAVESGIQKITKGVGQLFQAGSQQVVDAAVSDKERAKLRYYVESGQLNQELQQSAQPQQPQSFAEGGVAKAPASTFLETVYPEQAMAMGAAKGRINTYLNSIRPLPATGKLPYDTESTTPHQDREYNSALDIAIQPLSILNKVKDGSITPKDIAHFTNMHPELHEHLSKEMTKHIVESQVKEEKPPYHTRQGMSLFLGSPLDSTFTPRGIQAAQGVFQSQRQSQQSQPVPKAKKGTALLSKTANQHQTDDQARQARQDKD